MSSIDKRERNGKVTYRLRYRTPDGQDRSQSFAKLGDAKVAKTKVDASKLQVELEAHHPRAL